LTHAVAKVIDTLNLALKSELSAIPRAFGQIAPSFDAALELIGHE
jgi:hypothetical protein